MVVYKNLIPFILFWYSTTSFVVSNDVSISLASQRAEEIVQSQDFVYYHKEQITLKANKNYHLSLGQYYTALKITTLDSNYNPLLISASNQAYTIGMDPSLANDKEAVGSFIVFSIPQKNIMLKAELDAAIILELFYAPPIEEVAKSALKSKKENCEKPQTIAQQEWRAGLPPPTAGRKATVVRHCVIHHSAGSNTDTNYTNTVRNIYLLHTQSNGWDDIGYNFIIAQNGTIFSGRDALGVGDEDNIQGAHFCAKNSGTMGVCLLGNYNTTQPQPAMLRSLTDLLSWKLHKEELSTFDAFAHPDALGEELPSITMHRSGCPTACPGDNTATLLDSIRTEVQVALDQCGSTAQVAPKIPNKKRVHVIVYPNPSDGRFFVMVDKKAMATRYTLQSSLGQVVEEKQLNTNGYVKTDLDNGTYFVHIWAKDQKIATHQIVINRR